MLSLVILCVMLGVGHFLRSKVKLFQKLYLPSCVIGGLLALLLVQLLGLFENAGSLAKSANDWTTDIITPWGRIPGILINIVFACLFLGVKLPKLSTLWRRAGWQVGYGQVVAWGQYVVGLGLWIFVLARFFPDLPDMFAGILPVGFEGGHGTAAGMGEVFADHGWADGQDFALTSATCGILSAIIVGMVLVNWAVRKGYTIKKSDPASIAEDDTISIIPIDSRPIAGRLTVKSDAIETFSLHLVVVGLAIGIGYIAKASLTGIESFFLAEGSKGILSSFPLFPLCMLGGLVVQMIEEKFDKHRLIDLGLMRRIQNSALDFLVVAAIATIRMDVVMSGMVPLLILVAAGIGWNVFCVMVLAKRMLPDAWFERAIAEMGQSMGVTATGLLLLRVVDPDYDTPAADAFACKQIIHEPFMGGGLWTSTAIPLIAITSASRVFAISLSVMMFWLIAVWTCKIFIATKK